MRTALFVLVALHAATSFALDPLLRTHGDITGRAVERIGNYAAASPDSAAFAGPKNAITFDVIAPALNHITIGYERILQPRMSMVVKAGYIGLWNGNNLSGAVFHARGALFTAGLKLRLSHAAARTPSPAGAHPFAGWYLRPELLFSSWKRIGYSKLVSNRPYVLFTAPGTPYNYTSAAFVLNAGHGCSLGEHVTFDISGGIGYGAQWYHGEQTVGGSIMGAYEEYFYSHSFLGGEVPLVLCGGARLGYTF